MQNLIKIKCQINVFPEDRQRIKKKKKPFEEQTIIANVSNDLTHLYSSFIKKKYGIEIEPPPFGAHITIQNGKQEIKNIERYSSYLESLNGKFITVYYDPSFYLYWRFFAVSVFSEELTEIRNNLGIKDTKFHITLGKIKDNSIVPESFTSSLNGKHVCVELKL